MKESVDPPTTPQQEAPQPTPTPCRYCGAPRTTVIDRRGTRVLRHCDVCKLSWTTEEDQQ